MKTLIAFYSRTGFTRKVCQELAQKLNADLEEIIDTKSRKGPIGWLYAGRDASRKMSTLIAQPQKDPAQYDLVVLGTPIWAWTLTPALRAYLTQNKGKIKKAAFLCTMGGSGDTGAFAGMEELLGQKPAATMALKTKQVAAGQHAAEMDKFAAELKAN
jgi:flavodoxin